MPEAPVPIAKQLNQITSRLDASDRRMKAMQDVGGFADSATLSKRAKRIEDRLEILEADRDMLLDVNALLLGALREHLIDRHDAEFVRDNDRDVVNARKALRRIGQWAEKRGLRDRQRDVLDAQRDENSLRPRHNTFPDHIDSRGEGHWKTPT